MGGVSLWVVPHGYNVLMNSYKMDHIPHVTILNNLGYPRPTDDVGKEYEITVQGDLQPLYGTETVGVYCDVNVSHTIPRPLYGIMVLRKTGCEFHAPTWPYHERNYVFSRLYKSKSH